MAIEHQILGGPGRDNAVFLRINTGQKIHRILFDCGEGCPGEVDHSELLQLDHLCFSHFHMDHIAGFDSLFRRIYDRNTKANLVWGPPGTGTILHHRIQGFLWNLVAEQKVRWYANELFPDRVSTTHSNLADGFAVAMPTHDGEMVRETDLAIKHNDYTIDAFTMDHGTPSMAYVVRELDRVNVNTERMAARGWKPGPWLKRVRGNPPKPYEMIDVNGTMMPLDEVQAELLMNTPGDSFAYLTDFRMNETAIAFLAERLPGVGTIVCESQYRAADGELAEANKHMTATEAATLAARCNAGRLILFHVSDRYTPPEWQEMLLEARAIFPKTEFPNGW
jgi:ribonuclease Z